MVIAPLTVVFQESLEAGGVLLVIAIAAAVQKLDRARRLDTDCLQRSRQDKPHLTGATAEFFWAACHGLASLLAAGRIPNDRLEPHIETLGRLLTAK